MVGSFLAAQSTPAALKIVSQRIRAEDLTKAGAAEFLAEVFAFHLDEAAHFVQAGGHELANTVSQSFRAGRGPCRRNSAVRAGRWLILKVSRNDSSSVVVITG